MILIPQTTALILLLLPWSTAAQATFPCTKFWPTLPPNDHNITLPCQYLPGYPTTISGNPVSVLYTTDFDPSLVPLLSSVLTDTFTRTISVYSSLSLSSFPEIILLISNTSHPSYYLVTNQVEFPPAPCRVIGYSRWISELSSSNGSEVDPGPAQQKLAHEMYHCVQKWNLPFDDTATALPFPSWITEGSAMYFSNLAFPEVDLEWADSSGYNPAVALYAHDDVRHAYGGSTKSAYATGLFFQSLESVWGANGVNEFVLLSSQPNGLAGGAAERKRLSRDVVAIMGFERFSEEFTLGRAFGLGVRDTNGRYIPALGGSVAPATLVITDAEGKEGKVDIATEPFTVTEFVFQVDGGQIVMVSLGSRPKGGKVKYRLANQKEWMDLPTAGWGSKGFIVTPCEESVSVFLLFVSTADVDTDKATVLVKQFYKDETCPCKNGKQRRKGLKDGCDKKEKPKDEEEEEEEEQSGSCAGSNIPTDECFLATRKWSLDIPSTKALVEQKMKESLPTDGITGVVVSVTGSGGFEITGEEGKNVTMTYNNLNIETAVTIPGMSLPVSVKIDGVAEANMFTEAKDGNGGGSVCLVMYAGHGSAVGSNPLLGEVLRYDLAAKDWISQDWDVTYTCGGGKFSIHGVLNGATTFGPFVYNAVA